MDKAEMQRALDHHKQMQEDKKQAGRIEDARRKWGLADTITRLGLDDRWIDWARRRQEVDNAWDAVKPSTWGNRHSGERQMLYDILDPDETIDALLGGTFRADTGRREKHQGIASATSKRVVFLDKGVLGSTETMEMPYRNVEAITYSTGLMFGGIQITGRGMASFRIEDIMEKDSIPPFVERVRHHVETTAQQRTDRAGGSTAAPLDEIERLAGLAERGFITQDEFTAKKKQLLGL